jgi:hypothetical protein
MIVEVGVVSSERGQSKSSDHMGSSVGVEGIVAALMYQDRTWEEQT